MSALTLVLSAGMAALKTDVKKFALAFTAVFWIAYAGWIHRQYRELRRGQRRPEIRNSASAGRSGSPTKAPIIFALIPGLIIANVSAALCRSDQRSGASGALHQDRDRHSWRLLRRHGGGTSSGLRKRSILLRGIAAIVEAYLIYWAVVYFIARKWFGFSARMGGAAGFRHLDLRRFSGNCHRRRHPRAADGAGAGIVAGAGVRGRRSLDPAVRGARLGSRTSRWSPAPGWVLR